MNIYTMTNAKSPKRREARGIYILSTMTSKGEATVTKIDKYEDTTQNQAELKTLINALRRIKTRCELDLYIESPYVAAGFTQGWMKRWKEDDWKNAKGKEVQNKEEWEELYNLTKLHRCNTHLKEHHEYRNYLITQMKEK